MNDTSLEALAQSLAGELFGTEDRTIISSAYDALADGEAVSVEQLARRAGRSLADVRETLDRCNVRLDGDLIVAFGGLSLYETAHAFDVRGKRLYTWCAWDPLFIAPILGEDARVETTCPITGQKVTLIVGPDGVRDVAPPTAVLSMRVPDESCRTDTITNFCNVVLLFATADAANEWMRDKDEMFIVDLEKAFELGRLMVGQRTVSDRGL